MRVRRLYASALILLTCLLLAVLGSCRNILPQQKTEPGTVAPEKVTPERFLEAAARGDVGQVREFLETDPKLLEITDAAGWDALSYAAWGAHQQLHQFLLQRGAEGNLFTEAALGPWESFLRRLEINPLGANSRDIKQKAAPLIWAVRTGNQAGCEVLLSRGADVSSRDRDGNTALHHAALVGQLELLELLLLAGADVNARNSRGKTALHLEAESGDYAACQLLLDRGASLDVADDAGNTALHLAAGRGDLDLCEYFLFLGAQPSVKNTGGLSPRDLAEAEGHEKVARLLGAQVR